MPKRKRKTKTKFKYLFRRIFLVVILLGAIGGGGYFAYTKFFTDKSAAVVPASAQAQPNDAAEPSVSISSTESSKSEESSEPPSESSSSSESESEPSSSQEDSPDSESESKPETRTPVLDSDWELILVNPNSALPADYAPELETITDIYRVDVRISDSVKLMFADAKRDGINLTICSAYRSVEKQTALFEEKKQEYITQGKNEQEAVAAAATIIAKPGTSEHHTGLAMDIVTPSYMELDSGFANTPAFKWLDENAHKYGFVLRYPKDKQNITKIIYEPWHYRYVGEYNASVMKQKGLCLEEYVEALKQAKTRVLAQAAKSDEPAENPDADENGAAPDKKEE